VTALALAVILAVVRRLPQAGLDVAALGSSSRRVAT